MISVVISAHNEEKNIKDCIESAEDIASEIIVVDNSSTDKTVEVAKKMGAKVYFQENNPYKIDLQKNYGFSKVTQDWILSLDADERVTQTLSTEIKKVVTLDNTICGYFIPRKNIIFGKWIKNSIWWPDYQLRLFKKGKGKFAAASVHQPIDVKGDVRHLSEPLLHYNYESISQFVTRMNSIYTEVEAQEIVRFGKKLHWTEALKMPTSDFLKTFFLQKGYRDGLHGLVLSMLQAFYMFLVFAKVWEKQGFYEKNQKEVLSGVEHEFFTFFKQAKFWLYNSLQHETNNPIKKVIFALSKRIVKR